MDTNEDQGFNTETANRQRDAEKNLIRVHSCPFVVLILSAFSSLPYVKFVVLLLKLKRAIIYLLVPLSIRAFGVGTDFPAPYNSETDTNAVLISPREALSKLRLPPGFNATIFA